MELDVFRRMVLAAMVAVTPGAAVDVDIEGDDERNAHLSITVRRAGKTTQGSFDLPLPIDGMHAADAMHDIVRGVLELGA